LDYRAFFPSWTINSSTILYPTFKSKLDDLHNAYVPYIVAEGLQCGMHGKSDENYRGMNCCYTLGLIRKLLYISSNIKETLTYTKFTEYISYLYGIYFVFFLTNGLTPVKQYHITWATLGIFCLYYKMMQYPLEFNSRSDD
jgi:hypothetical protein